MKKLDVIFEGWGEHWALGTLADGAGHILFEYSNAALDRGLDLSPRHLKLGRQTYGNFPAYLARLPGLVSDALPDGWGMLLMDRIFRQGGRDLAAVSPLDRLAFIGNRAMGALSFRPAEEPEVDGVDWNLLKLAQTARDVEDADLAALRVLALAGGSPHGARPKALVTFDQGSRTVSTRDMASGEPWLVKFQAQNEHPEVCAIEHVYAQMARACGIDMGPTEHFQLGAKLAAFGTRRFDRERGMRVPVHSFAGALQCDYRVPSLDYETVLRATGFFTKDQSEVIKAFRLCVFNVVFNNRDDHAKNFSLRMNEDMRWQFAPGYDLTFNFGLGGYHQTSVMGEARAPARSDLAALASRLELGQSDARHIIDSTCQLALSLPNELDRAGVRRATRTEIQGAVEANVLRCGLHSAGPKPTARSPRKSASPRQ